MAKNKTVLMVTVIEEDASGGIVERLCQHRETYMHQEGLDTYGPHFRAHLLQCAYEGFDVARNKALLGIESDSVPRPLADNPPKGAR